MYLTKITAEEAKHVSGSDWNQSEWNKRIDSLSKNGDCQFYLQKEDGRDRLWAVYTIPEGIKLLNTFSPYASSVSNNGFCMVRIFKCNDELWQVKKILCKDANGNEGYCNNDKANRLIMAKNSRNAGAIYCSNI